jgi:hypothetical protein
MLSEYPDEHVVQTDVTVLQRSHEGPQTFEHWLAVVNEYELKQTVQTEVLVHV